MAINVIVLGNGSALPTIDSNQSAQIVEHKNQLYLIDCGEGTQIELRRNKIKIQKIDQVFISHLHGDHFFGLVGLLSTMHLLGRIKPLNIHGPVGLQEIIEIQFRNAGNHLSFEMFFSEITSAGSCIYENDTLEVVALPLKHRIPCYGFLFKEKAKPRKLLPLALKAHNVPNYKRKGLANGEDFIDEEGKTISNSFFTTEPEPGDSYAYCSDTAFYPKLMDYIQGVNLLYHESTFLDRDKAKAKKTFHSTAKQAAEMALMLGVKKLLLGHFSNRYKDRNEFINEARGIFENTEIGEEGKRFSAA